MKRKNYYLIDVVKFISAIFVVAIHTGPFLSINGTLNYFVVQILGRIAVPFYFVASSFLFFSKLDYSISLMAKDNLKFLKNFIFRILKLYLIWTLIYLTLLAYQWATKGFGVSTLVSFVRDFIFVGSYYHLWFLPAMIFSTILVYFMLEKLKTLRILEIAIVLYVIGMLINVYGDALSHIPGVNNVLNMYLNTFVTARNGLFFGTIFTTMGAYIAHNHFKLSKQELLKRSLICLFLLIIEGFFIRGLRLDNELTSMYFMLIPFMFYFFLYLLKFDLKKDDKYYNIRSYSTLIYLSHIYFAVILKLLPIKYNSFVYFILVFLISLQFSYVVCHLSKNPKMKFLKALY